MYAITNDFRLIDCTKATIAEVAAQRLNIHRYIHIADKHEAMLACLCEQYHGSYEHMQNAKFDACNEHTWIITGELGNRYILHYLDEEELQWDIPAFLKADRA